jgi:hypothetical protein
MEPAAFLPPLESSLQEVNTIRESCVYSPLKIEWESGQRNITSSYSQHNNLAIRRSAACTSKVCYLISAKAMFDEFLSLNILINTHKSFYKKMMRESGIPFMCAHIRY